MNAIARSLLLTAAVLVLLAGSADAQVLTWAEVQSMDWSGSIPVKLKAATDGVFDEGPDYWYDCEDEWFCESDVVTDVYDFTISVFNNRQQAVDDLVFLLAYKDGTFSSIDVGSWAVTPADFYDNAGEPFGPAGNRPGDGETALYNGAAGVVFVRIGTAVAGKDTVEVPVHIHRGRGVFTIHFDFYAVTFDNARGTAASWDCTSKGTSAPSTLPDISLAYVACTNAGSHDVTWDTPCYPSATVEETWSRIKMYQRSRAMQESRAP